MVGTDGAAVGPGPCHGCRREPPILSV